MQRPERRQLALAAPAHIAMLKVTATTHYIHMYQV